MSNVYRNLSIGGPGTIGHPVAQPGEKVPKDSDIASLPMDDPPLLEPEPRTTWYQLPRNREAWRNLLRLMQLVYIVVSLAFCRPQRSQLGQWASLLLLCHAFVLSALLLLDQRTGGRTVRQLLPRLDWAPVELRYTGIVALLMYVLSYGLIFSHKGYRSDVWCNWVSFAFTMKTALLYGADAWLQLQAAYGPVEPALL
uniref:Putative succinate dehydrogenase n=1 Tax=Anopheles triannulatus TaxID=58253 RepID=A0A2M4A6R7_9DIPT